MNEIRLAISFGALRALSVGNELVFDIEDDFKVFLRVDDEAMAIIREMATAYALARVPTSDVQH